MVCKLNGATSLLQQRPQSPFPLNEHCHEILAIDVEEVEGEIDEGRRSAVVAGCLQKAE
jgi:hypothetical protein